MIAEIWALSRTLSYLLLVSPICDRETKSGNLRREGKVDFLSEITSVTGSVATATKGKACRNPRDGNPEQEICKQLDTESQVFYE